MKCVLTIAGHDLSHGAGITKDLEVFSSLGLQAVSVPTSFVVQGPEGATAIEPVPMGVFSQMLEKAGEAFPLSGIKIGVLADGPHVEGVARFLAGRRGIPVVLDPVMAAKTGLRLITDEGLKALVERLLPLASSVTPNIDEAEVLVKEKIGSAHAMERAARAISEMGPAHVFLKGGHLAGRPVDLLFDGEEMTRHEKERREKAVHGTGCLFSSLLLSFAVMGYPAKEAFFETERLMERLVNESCQPREGGYFYAFPGLSASQDAERWEVLQAMGEAAERLREIDAADLVPAVQMNMGYAVRGARTTEDVAAFPGRIGTRRGRLCFKGPAEFGVSSPVARLCLTYMARYPFMRAAVDLRYDEAVLARARERGLSTVFRDRRKEPEEVKAGEGGSLDALVEAALALTEGPPDIIYDHGDVGKEPIIRLFAREPRELLNKMEMMRR